MSHPPTTRKPYDHALHLINHTNEAVNAVTTMPDGQPRNLPPEATSGVLIANAGLAVASALLAVADAIRAPRGAQ
ncbi:hypothetical protein [Streptomyces cadmiisoli]|uniref:hypothetical protein n=1 Tax=Streptomyces cadmiisoli TaxID=2184053 RepID=UPI003D70E730